MKIKDLSVFTKVHVKGQKQIPKSVKTIHITVIQQIIMKRTALDSGLLTLFTF